MTWADNLLPASFRDIEFDILSVDDEATRALARHAYPYTNGADVEDMGREARHVSVKAIFFGDDYEQRLQDFIAALDERGAGALVHPVFGIMELVQVTSYRISHQAEMPDACTVNIEFEESVTSAPFFDRTLASQKADAIDTAADDAQSASDDVLTEECNNVEAQSNGGALDALSRISAMRQQAVTFLLTLNNEVHGILTSITDPIRNVLGFVADVTSLCQSLIDLVPNELEYLQNFANANFNRIDRLLSTSSLQPVVASASNAPTSYAAWVANNAASAPNTVSSGGSVSSGASTIIPASSIYPVSATQSLADTQVFTVHIAIGRAVSKARVLALVVASEAENPHLTPRQVEQMVTTVRAAINDAIAQARTRYPLEQARKITEPLKTLAMTVQESGRSVINARPPLIVRPVESSAPVRLLAHLWYGTQSRGPELLRLNNLRQPNAITAGDKLNAYAK